jgi:hypothetical protein
VGGRFELGQTYVFAKVVRIPIQPVDSYDLTILEHHFDSNPTMNPKMVESMLSSIQIVESYTVLENRYPIYGLSRFY